LIWALAESYNEKKFRFEFKTFGERNKALRILDRAGFEYELVEDLRSLSKSNLLFLQTISFINILSRSIKGKVSSLPINMQY
jgi:hypothetical protein